MTPHARAQTARFTDGSSRYRLCQLAPGALIMTSKPRSCFDAPRAADTVEHDFSITLSPQELERRRSRGTRRVPAPVSTATPVEIGSHDNSEESQMFFSLAALRRLLDETPPAEDDLHEIAHEPSAPYSGVHHGYTCDFEEPVKPAATTRAPDFPRAATPVLVFDAKDDLHEIAHEASAPCGGHGQSAADPYSTWMPARDSPGAVAATPGHVFDVKFDMSAAHIDVAHPHTHTRAQTPTQQHMHTTPSEP